MKHRNWVIGATLVAAIVALGYGQHALDASTRVKAVMAPSFEVDPLWPKPLPNHWVLGNVIGVGVDANDHVFIVHRNDTFNATQEIGAFVKKYAPELEVKKITRVDGDGSRPGASIEFVDTPYGSVEKVSMRLHGMYWKGKELFVQTMSR